MWLGDCPGSPAATHLAQQVLSLGISSSVFRNWRTQRYGNVSDGFLASFCRGLARYSSTFWLFENSLCIAILSAQPQWCTRAWGYPELKNGRKHREYFGSCVRYESPALLAPLLLEARHERHSRRFQSEQDLLEELAEMLAPSLFDHRRLHARTGSSGILQHAAVTSGLHAKLCQDNIFCLRSLIPAEEARYLTVDYNQTSAQTFAPASFASILGAQSYDALVFARGFREDSGSVARKSWPRQVANVAINFDSWEFASGYSIVSSGYTSDESEAGFHHGNRKGGGLGSSQPQLSRCMARLHVRVRLLGKVLAGTVLHTKETALEHFMSAKAARDTVGIDECDAGAVKGHGHLLANLGSSAKLGAKPKAMGQPIQPKLWQSTIDLAAAQWYYHALPDLNRTRVVDMQRYRPSTAELLEARKLFESYYKASCATRLILFGVESGFLGIGHSRILPGDEVASIDRSVLRVVLRQAGDVYRMVGLAFVGTVEEQTLETRAGRGEFPLQVITLI